VIRSFVRSVVGGWFGIARRLGERHLREAESRHNTATSEEQMAS
jgi:hypothetical protein